MLNGVSDFISSLLSLLGSNRGWKIISILFFLTLGWWFVENQFGLVFFWNLERKVALLKELNSLAQDGITQNNELNPIYQSLVGELARSETPPILTLSFAVGFWKFFSGASFWFVLLVLALFVGAKPDDENITVDDSMTGLVMLGLIFGVVGVFLPFYSPLINYLGFPLSQMLLYGIFYLWWRKRKQRRAIQV
ncbi:MAG: hypothetical protein L6R45_14540 [Anaerolineae bacterium]|nr:hypothetical protein [Anaerolineae bacterium]